MTTDKQGPHYDRQNYTGDLYTVVYTIYGVPGATQTLRCWTESSAFEKPSKPVDIELITNSITIHKCSNVLHQVLPAEATKEDAAKRFCVIFQFSTQDPVLSYADVIKAPLKTVFTQGKITLLQGAEVQRGVLSPLVKVLALVLFSVGVIWLFCMWRK